MIGLAMVIAFAVGLVCGMLFARSWHRDRIEYLHWVIAHQDRKYTRMWAAYADLFGASQEER